MKIRTSVLACFLCLLSIVAFSPGCESTDSVREKREEVVNEKKGVDAAIDTATGNLASMQEALDAIKAERDRLSARVEELEAGTEERAAIEKSIVAASTSIVSISEKVASAAAKIDEAKSVSIELGRRIESADKVLESTTPGTPNAGTSIGSLVGMFVPGAAPLAPIIGAMFYRGLRLARAKRILEGEVSKKTTALDRVVASIDALAEIAPEVGTAISKHASVLDTIQSPIGKTEVDASQMRNSTKSVPTPIVI